MSHAFTRQQFTAALRSIGLSQGRFAELVKVEAGTVYHWGQVRTPFPPWVPLLLAAWQDNKRQAGLLADRPSVDKVPVFFRTPPA